MAGFFCLVDRLLNRFYTACGIVAAVLLVTVGICVLGSILTRLLDVYIAGLNAYSGYAMAGSSFLALAYTFRAGGHIRVAILRSKLGPTGRFFLELWCLALASGFASMLAFYLVKMTYWSWKFEERSEGAEATLLWIPQTLVAFGACVLALCCIHALIKTIVRRDADAAFDAPDGALPE